MLGDYLGDENQLHKEVMYAYIDTMDFTGQKILDALRQLLSGFIIPGN